MGSRSDAPMICPNSPSTSGVGSRTRTKPGAGRSTWSIVTVVPSPDWAVTVMLAGELTTMPPRSEVIMPSVSTVTSGVSASSPSSDPPQAAPVKAIALTVTASAATMIPRGSSAPAVGGQSRPGAEATFGHGPRGPPLARTRLSRPLRRRAKDRAGLAARNAYSSETGALNAWQKRGE